MRPARTRFAPSPTGFMHVGGMRTALYAWLVARQTNGQFILRLEDTDQAREVANADQHIMDSLHALGLDYDEGPDNGGPHGPYRQSERLDIYKSWAEKLIATGHAYADPTSLEQIQAYREQAQTEKRPFLYRNHRPSNAPAWDGSQPLRFKSDPKAYHWHDVVMGDLKTGPEVIDDFILIKSDGFPTYNFAHIVDDAEMQITHVIRGQEFLASMPNYLNLYEALGLDTPLFATMPHIMGPSGNKKLSKRDGAKDVLDYLRAGYLQEVMINFIASLGWNDGSEQEIFSVPELIDKFSLERVQRSGAHFDEQRLNWMNGAKIRTLDLKDLFHKVLGYWPITANSYGDTYKRRVLGLVQERLKYFAELPDLTNFFFEDLPINGRLITGHQQLKKLSQDQLIDLLSQTRNTLTDSDFSLKDLTARLNQLLEATGEKPAVLFSLIRIATTQAPASPGLADTLAVLGKEVSLRRLDQQLAAL